LSDYLLQNLLTGLLHILIASPGSFGSTFWDNESTSHVGSGGEEEAWSTAANASTVDENAVSQNDNLSSGNNVQAKTAK